MKKLKIQFFLSANSTSNDKLDTKNWTSGAWENKKVTSQSPLGVPSRIRNFVTSLSYFLVFQSSWKYFNLKFDEEFADKKNCIFSFFVFSKFVEQVKIQSIASYCLACLYYIVYCMYISGNIANIAQHCQFISLETFFWANVTEKSISDPPLCIVLTVVFEDCSWLFSRNRLSSTILMLRRYTINRAIWGCF